MYADEEKEILLTVRHPLPGTLSLKQISLPPTLKLQQDIVALLLEERSVEP